MIPVLTTAQMRYIDDQAIGGKVSIGYSYMLRAGLGVLDAIQAMHLDPVKDEIAIVCGKGNNGGDGYAVGRMLLDKGYKVMCYGLCGAEKLIGEARQAFDEYLIKDGNFFVIDDIADLEGFGRFSLIVDALLGTGIKGDPHGLYAEIIKMIDGSGKPVVAIDTPSGLNNDTAKPGNPTVHAHCTVTMGYPKIGQLFYPGRQAIGKLIVHELGYPMEITEQYISNMFLPTRHDLIQRISPRKPAGSKFDHGLCLILSGSRTMLGCTELSSMAALRSGCGMVHCAVCQSLLPVLSAKVTEPVLHELLETDEGCISKHNTERVSNLASVMQAILIGPGISHHESTQELVRSLVGRLSIPTVLDADGINAFKDHVDSLKSHSADLIITPHKREWERLFGIAPTEPLELVNLLTQKAQQYAMTIVYKGNPTIVAGKDSKIYILPIGTSGMATAGSGDVLSGILVSLLAQGCDPVDAAIVGTAIHGLAGEDASQNLTDYGMIASDIINAIPRVFKNLLGQRTRSIFSYL